MRTKSNFKEVASLFLFGLFALLLGAIGGYSAGTVEERIRAEQRNDQQFLLTYDHPTLEIHP